MCGITSCSWSKSGLPADGLCHTTPGCSPLGLMGACDCERYVEVGLNTIVYLILVFLDLLVDLRENLDLLDLMLALLDFPNIVD